MVATRRQSLLMILSSLIALAAPILRSAAAPPATQTAPGLIIPGQSVDRIAFDMSQDQVRDVLGEPDQITGNAWEYLRLGMAVMFTREQPRVIAIFCGDACLRGDPPAVSPLVSAFKCKTADGLGMNSTTADVRRILGAKASEERTDGDYVYLNYRDRGLHVTLYKGRVVHLVLRQTQPPPPGR